MDKYSLYSKDSISIENPKNGIKTETKGINNIKIKGAEFYKQFSKVLKRQVSDPVITDDGFFVYFDIEGIDKNDSLKSIHEKAIYRVFNNQIVYEEFLY